jgi:Icc-related predicted phosphoesterase
MIIGAVADIHGNFDALRRAMERHPDIAYWVCVGDLASRTGAYPQPVAPLYWIKGNNEDFDRIAAWEAGEAEPPNLHFIRNGTATDVGGLRIAGLGGTFAPSWHATPAAQLPHTPRDDKRRHFVREEVEACARLRGVHILLTHEAARPFIVIDDDRPGRGARRRDAGKPAINEVLASLKPRLHLCGHHHRFSETMREGVPSVCIDRIGRSYLLIDTRSYEYRMVEATET